MNKNFTKEDIQKKHETNIKSAVTVLLLAGVLGLCFVIRYIFKGNLDFFFSFSFTKCMLMLYENQVLSIVPMALLTAIFLLCYTVFLLKSVKNPRWLFCCLVVYLIDFAFTAVNIFLIEALPPAPEAFIDVIFHLFVILFAVVGIRSYKSESAEQDMRQSGSNER